jgi:hypothetical protein
MHQIGKENQEALKENRTYQLLVCRDDVGLPGDNFNPVKKVKEALLQGGQD